MLASFPIRGTSSECRVSFWSHMKGQDVGSLAVLLRMSYGNGPADFFVIANITGKLSSSYLLIARCHAVSLYDVTRSHCMTSRGLIV